MTGGRYRTLDAWRGIAALAVVVFHCTTAYANPRTFVGAVLLSGWTGVFVFFPISGYCVFAAVSRQENATVRQFLRRRWHRILPPYWASVAVTLVLALSALPFNHATLESLNLSAAEWLSLASLTQVFLAKPMLVNPVYWSLCYEEQFYAIVALLLLAPVARRSWIVLGLSLLAVAYGSSLWPAAARITGLFLSFWLPFSGGVAVYLWLERPGERPIAAALLLMLCGSAVVYASPAWGVSAVVSVLFIVLAPFDRQIAASRLGAALMKLGLISYSLYLVHVPIGGRLVNLMRRWPVHALTVALAAVAASIIGGWLFYRAVECRFLNGARASERPLGHLAPALT